MFFVSKAVIDLRREPIDLDQTFQHNPLRETQLLYAEPIEVLQEGTWCYIHAKLQNYKGWVKKEELSYSPITYLPNCVINSSHAKLQYTDMTLSYGTCLVQDTEGWIHLPNQTKDRLVKGSCRPIKPSIKHLVDEAKLFLDTPYLWGGCSGPLAGQCQSVDCSGLVHLLYRAQGLILPRDAKDQVAVGDQVSSIQPGDAVYLYHENKKAHHVILCLSKDMCIESPKTGLLVRLLTVGQDVKFEGRYLNIPDREPTYGIIKRFSNLPRSLRRAFV